MNMDMGMGVDVGNGTGNSGMTAVDNNVTIYQADNLMIPIMSTPAPFDADKIISLWTNLLQLQVDIGYYPSADSISFPPPEGRAINETLCQGISLTDEVMTLLKHLPCPSDFNTAYDTPIMYESMAVPFTDNKWILNSRDLERYFTADEHEPLRPDYMELQDLALVLAIDEPGRHLILDTKANTIRHFNPIDAPYDSHDEDQPILERPHDRMHYRNYPARPTVEVLEELVAKFRDLEWIPIRPEKGVPNILTAWHDDWETTPNAWTNARRILREQFGWPNNFDKERWNRERDEIWKSVLHPNKNI